MRSAMLLTLALCATSAQAGWFSKGVGAYGPYTGGHGYSYNVAYSYGFAWSAADTWKRDLFAYPGGITPYRPYGRPISKTVFPHPQTPYIAIPGLDGLPTLVQPGLHEAMQHSIDGVPATPSLLPLPTEATQTGTIHVQVPESAQVWVEKEQVSGTGADRTFQTPPLAPNKTQLYSVRAKWTEAGREVDQYRVVGVQAGETAKVTFVNE